MKIIKQEVQAIADLKAGYTLGHADVAILNELARIALASLEAEPVGEVSEQRDGLVMDGTVDLGGASTHRIIKGASKMKRLPLGTKFYTAPPAQANAEPVAWLWSHRKHPSEVTLVRPEDDERAEGAHWSGWSCQALYAAPPVPVSVPDGYRLQPISEYDAMCAAMLQGAEPVSQPCTLPDGYCVMPLKLTSENGAKGALSGEFHVTNRIVCQSCAGEGCEDCNDEGGWDAEIPVSWDTIKRIHEAAVEACSLPAAPQQEVKP